MGGGIDHILRGDVARLMRERRESAGFTQAELAVRLGTQQSFVSKYEAGERRLDIIELYAICGALSLSFLTIAVELDAIWKSRQ